MTTWPLYSLKQFIRVKHGFAFKGEYFTDEATGFVVVTPGNFAIGGGFQNPKPKWYDQNGTKPKEYVLHPGDLLVTMTDLSKDADTLGYSALVPDDQYIYLHNQRIGLITIENPDKLDKGYLYFVMRSKVYREQVVATASGSTVHHTSPDRIGDVRFPLPTLPIQRRIAEILGRLDDKIEVNRRINRTLEAMAQALYQHWFVDFGPFQESEFVESELGLMPKGWRVEPLSSHIDLLSGGTPSTKVPEYWDGDIWWISAKDVSEGMPFIMTTERTISTEGLKNSSTRILPPFTSVITARGTVGECGLVPYEMAMNQTNYGVRGRGELGNFTMYLVLVNAVTTFKNHAYGTVFDTITRKTFDSIKLVVPPESIWVSFELKIKNWYIQILNNQRQNQKLTEIRDYLLPKLLSGEIAVEAAEEVAGVE